MINLILIFLIFPMSIERESDFNSKNVFFTVKCPERNENRIRELFGLELKLYLKQTDTEHKFQLKNSKLIVKCLKSKFSVIISNETTKRSASRIFIFPEKTSDKERIIAIAASQMLSANLEKRIKEIHRLKILKRRLKNYKITKKPSKQKNTVKNKLFFSTGAQYIVASQATVIPFYAGVLKFGKKINDQISLFGKTSFYYNSTIYASGSVTTGISELSAGIIFDIQLVKNFTGIYAEAFGGIAHIFMKGNADDLHTDGLLSRITSVSGLNLGIFFTGKNSFKIRLFFSIETFQPKIKGIVSDDNNIVIGGLLYGIGISGVFFF